jgi:hypothetical protein
MVLTGEQKVQACGQPREARIGSADREEVPGRIRHLVELHPIDPLPTLRLDDATVAGPVRQALDVGGHPARAEGPHQLQHRGLAFMMDDVVGQLLGEVVPVEDRGVDVPHDHDERRQGLSKSHQEPVHEWGRRREEGYAEDVRRGRDDPIEHLVHGVAGDKGVEAFDHESVLTQNGADVGQAQRRNGRVEVLESAELLVEINRRVEKQNLHVLRTPDGHRPGQSTLCRCTTE